LPCSGIVADRHALRAADIDGILSRPRFPLINQIHQRLRRRHQIKVMADPSLAPAPPWAAPAMSQGLLIPGEHHLGIRPAG
jgi:hypothetical protein